MMVQLSTVLGILYGLSIGGAFGMSTVRMISAIPGLQPAPAKRLSFFEALDRVFRRSVTFFAFTFILLWLLGSPDNMAEPEIALLLSANVGWRMYVLVSILGVSLIMSAFEFLLCAVFQHIGRFIMPRWDRLDAWLKAAKS